MRTVFRRNSSRLFDRRRLGPALGLALVLLGPAAAAQQGPPDPPVLEVVFQVAPGSRFDRSPAQRDGARRLITTKAAALGQTYFGFMGWSPVLQRASASGPMFLAVRLEDVTQGAGKDKILRFLAKNGRTEVDLTPLDTVLYPWPKRDLPADAAGLAQDVNRELIRLFSRDDFRRTLHERLLSEIPLATMAETDQEARRIVIPLRWEALRSKPDSVLRVEFEIRGQVPRQGMMKLSSVQKRIRDPHLGGLQGAISLLDCAPLILRNLGDWNDEIPILLDRRALRQLSVFMEIYVPRGKVATEGGLVTRLPGGGS